MENEEGTRNEVPGQQRRAGSPRRRRRGGRRHKRRGRSQPESQAPQQTGSGEPAIPEPLQLVEVEQPLESAPQEAPVEEEVTEQPALPVGTSRRIACAIISVTDTRTLKTDASGRAIRTHLSKAPFRVRITRIIKDQPADIRKAVLELLNDDELKVILFTGGTGIGVRDRTVEVLESVFEKEIPGFGELFRQLAFHEIGAAAILSRAVAGVARQKLIACLPGSPQAVRLAMERILLPELPHIVEMLDQ